MLEGFLALFFFFFAPLAAVLLKKDLEGLTARKILENLECRKSHLPHFLGLFFIFLFFINQFSLFFSAIL